MREHRGWRLGQKVIGTGAVLSLLLLLLMRSFCRGVGGGGGGAAGAWLSTGIEGLVCWYAPMMPAGRE